MSGKTSTSTSNVQVPASVLAQYQSVNAAADQTAATPFEDYSGQFVAPVNAEQTAGITATNAAANEAQPYYGAATGVLGATQAATTPVNTAAEIGTAESGAPISGADINSYLSPYLGDVLSSTEAIQNQENQQAQAGQLGDAITSGAFGSDRTGIAAANLQQQENLANSSTIANIANTGYQSALTEANTEQQTGLAAANQLASIGSTAYGEGANTANELGTLGTGAQAAGLSGAQAQIAAGTVQQQTQQAQDTAEYNQFLQQQSYPFQVDQFLADIAEGTGSLSGSTTTTTQPGGFFSDRRLKRDIKKIGETFDHQDVVTYKMGNDERTRIGLIAQDVEKKHPHAVGLAGGFKIVDYGKATQAAANKGHFRSGGVVPFRRVHRDMGGGLSGVLQAQQQMYANMRGSAGMQINSTGGGAGGRSLPVANAPASPPPSGASELSQTMGLVNNADKLYKGFTTSTQPSGIVPAESTGPLAPTVAPSASASGATGVVPAAPEAAGVQASGAVTAAAPEATATAAPAAASSAAGSAAAGAAGAAAPAAADAAGTAAAGAAGGVAAGAGTEAAADAAAALAAEYAAADVGTVALMAAKRGGRAKLQGGGVPYLEGGENASGELNIPDEANTNTLKAAPAAAKQPTGFQDLLYMGDPNNTSSLMGSMFSNEAMATGGVAGRRVRAFGGPGTEVGDPSRVPYPQVSRGAEMRAPGRHRATGGLAGRRGFDGGGGATDDDDPTTVPTDDANVTASGPSASAPAATPTSGGGLAGWWGRNKGLVLPILSGIGAAGTARTVHPGVALAAGLEGFANAYTPTQEGLAVAQQTQAAAQGQQIRNQILGLKSQAAQKTLGPYLHESTPPPGGVVPQQAPPATANPAPAIIAGASPAPGTTTSYQSPLVGQAAAGTPPAATATPRAAAGNARTLSGMPAAENLDSYYRNMFFNPDPTAFTPSEQQRMNNALAASGVAGDVVGQAPVQQAQLAHDTRVRNNRNQAQELSDGFYKQYTDPNSTPAQKANALANYTALRQYTGDTSQPSGGIMKNSRTTDNEIGMFAQQGMTPTERSAAFTDATTPVVVGNQLPIPRYKAAGYATPDAYVAANAAASQIGGAAGTAPNVAPPSTTSAVAPVAATAPRASAPASPGRPQAPTAAAPNAKAADPYLSKALADPTFNPPPAPKVVDQTTQKAAFAQQEAAIGARTQLMTDSQEATTTAAQSLTYLNVANQIMQSKGGMPLTGVPGEIQAEISRYTGGAGVNASNYYEVAKNLSNAALQGARATYGARMTQSEVQLQLNEMNPSLHSMPPQAISDLIKENTANAQYAVDTASRVGPYISDGKDPQQFAQWNQKYFPRQAAVSAGMSPRAPAGAVAYLKTHPETESQFKAKYGYVP